MVESIRQILLALPEVEFAYLFGSYAKGTQVDQSDLDIAIFINNGFDFFDTKLKVHHALEIALHKEIDLVVLNSAKNFSLLEDIFENNIILKESLDDSRVVFELDLEHQIKDYKVFQRLLDVA